MNNILIDLKLGISAHLEKQGSSLEEFEHSLSTLNEADGAVKVAELMLSLADMQKEAGWADLLKTMPELAFTSAALVGTAGGAGLYGLKSYMDGKDKSHNKQEEEVNRIKILNERLQQDYGIPQQHHA